MIKPGGISTENLFYSYKNERVMNRVSGNKIITKKFCKLAAKIFNRTLLIIVDDIIDNNRSFRLPTMQEAYLEPYKVPPEEFKNPMFRFHKPKVDPLRSNFFGICFSLRHYAFNRWKTKFIILDPKRRQRMIDNLYNGRY